VTEPVGLDSVGFIYTENLIGAPSGLAPGDHLIAVNGSSLARNLPPSLVDSWRAGQTMRYTVVRAGQELTLAVPLVHWRPGLWLTVQLHHPGELAGTLGLLMFVAIALFVCVRRPATPAAANPVADTTAAETSEQIARGEKFAPICADCHGSNHQLPLTGQDFAAHGLPIGTLWAPNLTPAHFKNWSDGEIIRAIREGVSKDGRSLAIMPSEIFHNLSDDDVQAIVAYLRAQPAVEPDTPAKQFNVLGAIMAAALLPDEVFTHQPPITEPMTAPPAGQTPEYGRYLTTVAGCTSCHGAQLEGGQSGEEGSPPGPSLVAFAKQHTDADFVKTIRTGVTPEGRTLSENMPWRIYQKFSDDDLRALYAYILQRR
jgi:cytochrome c553